MRDRKENSHATGYWHHGDRQRPIGGWQRRTSGARGRLILRDGRIVYAGPEFGCAEISADATRIDARGGTILPGLVEAHFHATYFNVAELADLDIKYPVEYVTLLAAANAQLALECGYTAARSGGSLHNIDVWLKKAIEEDLFPGPRLAASGREICGSGGLMDWNPDHLGLGMEGLILLVNGPNERARPPANWSRTESNGSRLIPRGMPPATMRIITRCA